MSKGIVKSLALATVLLSSAGNAAEIKLLNLSGLPGISSPTTADLGVVLADNSDETITENDRSYSFYVIKEFAMNGVPAPELTERVYKDSIFSTSEVGYRQIQLELNQYYLPEGQTLTGVSFELEYRREVCENGSCEFVFDSYYADNNGSAFTGQISLEDWRRTVIFIYGRTEQGQDMFIRGGVDSAWSNEARGTDCTASVGGDINVPCSMPIRHLNQTHAYTSPWRTGDNYLDWGKLTAERNGREAGQTQTNAAGEYAVGTPLVWTTDDASYPNQVDGAYGGGYTPLNTYGPHYWMLDVEMDCSKTVTYNDQYADLNSGWFELKNYISNGPGWEADIAQPYTPYASRNHFAQCGRINVFRSGEDAMVDLKDFTEAAPTTGFTSNLANLFLRTANSWGIANPMELIANNVWEGTTNTWKSSANQIKFDVLGDWSENYGDNDADGYVDFDGDNISINGCYAWDCTDVSVRFDDSDYSYALCYNSVYHTDRGNTALCDL